MADDTLLPLLQRATLADKPGMKAQAPVHRIHFLRKWGWAAAVLVLLSVGAVYFWRSGGTGSEKNSGMAQAKNDIAPGRDGAILSSIEYGQLLYADNLVGNNGQIQWNTMQTRKGRQFNVTLPDGTRVWLNAASSIFRENKRQGRGSGSGNQFQCEWI